MLLAAEPNPIDWNIVLNSLTVILTSIVAGYFALKMAAIKTAQDVIANDTTETKHLVNAKSDKTDAEIKALTLAVKQLTAEKATLVEQARDKSGDLPGVKT